MAGRLDFKRSLKAPKIGQDLFIQKLSIEVSLQNIVQRRLHVCTSPGHTSACFFHSPDCDWISEPVSPRAV